MAGNMNNLMVVHLPVVGAATFTYTLLRGAVVVDIIATSNFGAGTIQPQTTIPPAAATNILGGGGTMNVGTISDIVYGSYVGGTAMVPAQQTLTAGCTITAIGSNANTDADVCFEIIPTSWISG